MENTFNIITKGLEANEWGDIQATFRADDEYSACATVYKDKNSPVRITWYSQSDSGVAEASKLLALLTAATEYAKTLEA